MRDKGFMEFWGFRALGHWDVAAVGFYRVSRITLKDWVRKEDIAFNENLQLT